MMTVPVLFVYSFMIYVLTFVLIGFDTENTVVQRTIDVLVVLLLMLLILMVLLTMVVGVNTYV